MIKRRHTNHYERKMQSNRVEYSTAAGVYCTTHGFKVPFCMPELSSSNIINHCFHVDNDEGESGICYDMIIGRDVMVQLGHTDNFKRQVLQWDGTTVHMKESRNLLGKSNLTKREICKVIIQNAEAASTQEDTERMVKILNRTYSKVNMRQVVNASQLNDEETTLLLSLLKDVEDLFDGTLGDWATEPVDLELKADTKPFNRRYYPVPRFNKEKFRKELQTLVEI